jgi:hypothetical protein
VREVFRCRGSSLHCGDSWRAVLNVPRRWHGKGWHEVLDEPGLRYVSNFNVAKRQAVIEHVLTLDVWSVPAEHAAAYNRVFTKANTNLTRFFARTLFGLITPPPDRCAGYSPIDGGEWPWLWLS